MSQSCRQNDPRRSQKERRLGDFRFFGGRLHLETPFFFLGLQIMSSPSNPWCVTKNDVLFEDEWIIAINKPSGLPSQATLDPARDHAFAAVSRYLGGHYVGLHHRLDAGTSGVLLLAKNKLANPSLSAQFQDHSVQKTYVAIAAATQPDTRVAQDAMILLKDSIGEDKTSRIQKFCVGGKNRKYAETQILCQKYLTLRDGFLAWFACQPRTGRTHQIRVHLASLGFPILGDTLYGNKPLRSILAWLPDRLCLHAAAIALKHPVTGENMTIEAPCPTCFQKFIKKMENIAVKTG
jgi:RluA family pseudouridine synthase